MAYENKPLNLFGFLSRMPLRSGVSPASGGEFATWCQVPEAHVNRWVTIPVGRQSCFVLLWGLNAPANAGNVLLDVTARCVAGVNEFIELVAQHCG